MADDAKQTEVVQRPKKKDQDNNGRGGIYVAAVAASAAAVIGVVLLARDCDRDGNRSKDSSNLERIAQNTGTTAGNTGKIARHAENYGADRCEARCAAEVASIEKALDAKFQPCQAQDYQARCEKDCVDGKQDSSRKVQAQTLLHETKKLGAEAEDKGITVRDDACWKTAEDFRKQREAYALLAGSHKSLYDCLAQVSPSVKSWREYIKGLVHTVDAIEADIVSLKGTHRFLMGDREWTGTCSLAAPAYSGPKGGSRGSGKASGGYTPTRRDDSYPAAGGIPRQGPKPESAAKPPETPGKITGPGGVYPSARVVPRPREGRHQ